MKTALPLTPGRLAALLALVLFTLDGVAQCARRPSATSGPAFELATGTALLTEGEDLFLRPGVEMALLGRGTGPLKTGLRLGITDLGRISGLQDPEGAPDGELRYRMGLLSAGSVVRLDPLTGGLRPFVEGQFGLAASLVDRRSMDLDGIRTSHAITSFDPTAYYGWSAGTRIRVGRGTFLSFRYGETQGGQLDRHSTAEPEGVPTPLDPRRRAVMVGFSFGR